MYAKKTKQKESETTVSLAQRSRNPVAGSSVLSSDPVTIQMRQLSEAVNPRPLTKSNNQLFLPSVPVFQRMGDSDSESDVEIDSDLEDDNVSSTAALEKCYKTGKVPKNSKQAERVLKLRRELRKESLSRKDPGGSMKAKRIRIIKARKLQHVLARLNLEYSPQNTTAIGIGKGAQQNEIVTKMAGANANYLKRVLGAKLKIERAKSSKGSNKYHAEKVLSALTGKKPSDRFRRIIIDKARCDICKHDSDISDSADVVRD